MDIQQIINQRIEIVSIVKNILIEELNLSISKADISDDTILFGGGLGLDSIDALQLIVGIEAKTGIVLPEGQLSVLRTINSIVDYILKAKGVVTNDASLERMDPASYSTSYSGEYSAIRHSLGLMFHSEKVILKFSGDDALATLNQLVTGKVNTLPENSILQTLVLKDDGTIGAYVEVYNNFESLLMIIDEAKYQFIFEQLAKINLDKIKIENLSSKFDFISLHGPNALRTVETYLGDEIFGIRPYMFTNIEQDGNNLIIARISKTGEFGYVIFCPKSYAETLVTGLEHAAGQKIQICNPEITKLLALEACIFNESNYADNVFNPLEMNLQWTIDFNKEQFIGKDALISTKSKGIQRKLIPFHIESVTEVIEKNSPIYINAQQIGHIVDIAFSPILGRYIGMAYITPEYAYPDLKMKCKTAAADINIQTISSPFFATDSHLALAA